MRRRVSDGGQESHQTPPPKSAPKTTPRSGGTSKTTTEVASPPGPATESASFGEDEEPETTTSTPVMATPVVDVSQGWTSVSKGPKRKRGKSDASRSSKAAKMNAQSQASNARADIAAESPTSTAIPWVASLRAAGASPKKEQFASDTDLNFQHYPTADSGTASGDRRAGSPPATSSSREVSTPAMRLTFESDEEYPPSPARQRSAPRPRLPNLSQLSHVLSLFCVA